MWQRDSRTEEQIYTEIAQGMVTKFKELLPECGDAASFVADEIFKAKYDSDNAVHCFFSPSKSNGWVSCPAYLDRSKQWDGTKEPAIRGTIVHHFLSKAIEYLKSGVYSKEFDWITAIVFQHPDWLSEPGVNSVIALLKKVIELGVGGVRSEVFLLSPDCGVPNKNLRFGGSIDILHIKVHDEFESPSGVPWADIHIYDLKTGKNPVSPNCWQLKCYALLVRDWMLEEYGITQCSFTLGIAQDGKIAEHDFSNNLVQSEAFMKIKRAMYLYDKVYMENRLNVEINDEVDSAFQECFNPCPYCRFCRGCYKREMI